MLPHRNDRALFPNTPFHSAIYKTENTRLNLEERSNREGAMLPRRNIEERKGSPTGLKWPKTVLFRPFAATVSLRYSKPSA
jgi:hypothetical protein